MARASAMGIRFEGKVASCDFRRRDATIIIGARRRRRRSWGGGRPSEVKQKQVVCIKDMSAETRIDWFHHARSPSLHRGGLGGHQPQLNGLIDQKVFMSPPCGSTRDSLLLLSSCLRASSCSPLRLHRRRRRIACGAHRSSTPRKPISSRCPAASAAAKGDGVAFALTHSLARSRAHAHKCTLILHRGAAGLAAS